MDEQHQKLLSTTDASVWATAFIEQLDRMEQGMDEGTIVAWFANAIEVGRSAGAAQEARTHDYEAGMAAAGIPISNDSFHGQSNYGGKPVTLPGDLGEAHTAVFPAYESVSDEQMESVLFQALGAASMCWIPHPSTQIFDSTRAKNIGDEAMAILKQYVHEKIVALEDKIEAETCTTYGIGKKLAD